MNVAQTVELSPEGVIGLCFESADGLSRPKELTFEPPLGFQPALYTASPSPDPTLQTTLLDHHRGRFWLLTCKSPGRTFSRHGHRATIVNCKNRPESDPSEFERSGLSAAAFARKHRLRYTTFSGWRHRSVEANRHHFT